MIYKARLDPGYVDKKIFTLFYTDRREYALYSPERELAWTHLTVPMPKDSYNAELMRLVNIHLEHPSFGVPAEEVGLETDIFPGLRELLKCERNPL